MSEWVHFLNTAAAAVTGGIVAQVIYFYFVEHVLEKYL